MVVFGQGLEWKDRKLSYVRMIQFFIFCMYFYMRINIVILSEIEFKISDNIYYKVVLELSIYQEIFVVFEGKSLRFVI